ncbi:hypothetical protein [Niallia sp. Man26]|uniref:hypothetical protein n=1 Tax=Niallia sp. Man26 TaxID=2912824 RepID=UPI002054B023|nr:hypothetical protein [Niallia sp. Man26]UPO91085.1 hypothetical protein L8T27_026365 [Niallia sp. Man26]
MVIEREMKQTLFSTRKMDRGKSPSKKSLGMHWDGSFSYKGESWILSSNYAEKEILVKEFLEGLIRVFYQGDEISKLQRRKKIFPFSVK